MSCAGCDDTGLMVTVEPASDGGPGGDVRACPMCRRRAEPEHAAVFLAGELARLLERAGGDRAMVPAGDALVFVTRGDEARVLERLIRAQGGGPM